MGFMDKAREAAQQATTKAQQGLAQGQAKLDEVQTTRAADGLLRDLGTAFYAEQRSSGSHEAVMTALGAVDAHVAAHGPLGQTGQTGQGSPQAVPPQHGTATGSPSGTPAAQPPADPPAPGGFTLNDL